MRLFSRTALPIFAAGAILLAAGVYGASRVHRLHQRGTEMLSGNVASIVVAKEFETVAVGMQHRLKRYLSSGDDRHLEHVWELMPRGVTLLDRAHRLSKSSRERELVGRMRQGYDRLRSEFAQLADGPAEERDRRMLHLADERIPNDVLTYTGRYVDLNERQLESSNQRNQSTANHLVLGLLTLGTCGGVAGLFAGYAMAHLVHRTIVQLTIPIRDAAGKLSQVAGPVAVSADPGFGDLELILRRVSDHVTAVVARLQDSERDRLRAEQLAAVGQLAAGLAHELRNPLTSMKAIIQLAEEPRDLSARDLEVLREESERLEYSVQSLLDFARPPQPRKTRTDLRALVQQTVLVVRRRAEGRGVPVVLIPAPCDLMVMADAAQLRQVVLNLLLNAIEVTPRGGAIRVECRVEASDLSEAERSALADALPPRAAWAVLRVQDTGPGLPSDLGDHIFQPFVTTKETGTGLGLSICKQILEAHGGSITARNRRPQGAVFEVRIPLGQAASAERGGERLEAEAARHPALFPE